tara:strand:- start:1137 stop:4745 length:3609 start_codon:yes stop_codon:yes gene_type:complete
MAELYVNVNGTWKQATNYYVNVNGYWKEGSELHAKVSSAWKQSGSTVYSGTSGIVTTNIVLDLNATLTNSYGGSGTTWTDLSGEGNNATLVNGPSYNSSHGGYLIFDGSNDYVSLGTSINSDISVNKDCSFNIWIQFDIDSRDNLIISHPSIGTGNDKLILWYDKSAYGTPNNTGSNDVGGGTTNILAVAIKNTVGDEYRWNTGNNVFGNSVTSTWHNICLVFDTTNDKYYTYLNGQQVALFNSTAVQGIDSNVGGVGQNFHIGKSTDSHGSWLDGNVSMFQVYSKALTASEVLQNYNATKSNYTDLITTDLVLYLDASNFDSYTGSGTTFSDISGNNNDLTLTNGPTFNSQDGGVIVFDGTNDFAVSPLNQAFFQFGTGDYSYGLWVKFDTLGDYEAPLSSGRGGEQGTNDYIGSWQIDYGGGNTKINHKLGSSSGNIVLNTSLTPSTGTWYYLFVVNDRSENELKLYVNGSLNTTSSNSGYGSISVGNYSNTTSIYNVFNIGRNRNQDAFIDGSVGQVHVYKGKALSASEVLQNYNATKGNFLGAISTTDLVFYLDASKSMSYSGSGTTWTDLSSSSNNGTLTNGPIFDSVNGGSIVFDGTNDYVQFSSDLFNPNSDFTISAWINIDTLSGTNSHTIVSSLDATGSFQLRYKNGTGLQVVKNFVVDVAAFSYSETLATGTWYNITVSRSSNTYTYYLNGSQVSSFTNSVTYGSSPRTIGINRSLTNIFDGKIAQVFAYDEALTASVILSNYNAIKSSYHELITTNLVLHLDASNSSSYSGSGTTWSNLASSSLNATLVNGVTFSSDNGGTFVFDGTNDYAEITSASALGGFSGDFTIEFWYKATNEDSYDTLFDFNGESNATIFRWGVQAAVGGSNMALRRDSAFAITTSGIDAFDNNWHHHVIARNGSTITYYIDNVSRGTETYSGSISSGTHLKIGGFSGGGYHIQGSLPQVRIYDGTGFTASQVLQNYNATKSQYLGLITTNLVLHLDASNSSSYSGSGTTWTDLSSSSNDGTLTNGVTYDSNNGGVLVFDGTDDYVVTSSDMFNANADFTLSVWLLSDTFATGVSYAVVADVANSQSLYLRYNDGSFKLVNSNTAILGTFSSSSLSTNTWYDITLTRSSNTYTLYVNGSSVSSLTGISHSFTHSPTTIGANNNNSAPPAYKNNFDGKIAQVLAYSAALSASEVQQNYNATKATYGY